MKKIVDKALLKSFIHNQRFLQIGKLILAKNKPREIIKINISTYFANASCV